MFIKTWALLAVNVAFIAGTVLSQPRNTIHQRYPADPAASVLVPFVNGSSAHLNFTNDPSIRYHFSWEGGNSTIHTVLVDTGSVGAVIGAYYFPNWKKYQTQIQQGVAGHILYTSSGKLLTGYFVDVDFEFDDGSLPLKAHGPILVVDRTVSCSNYTTLIDGNYCPEQYIDGPDLCNELNCTNSYFGIGWSRGTNPASNNPLLNVVSINNKAISADYTFGYTLTEIGLHVGLTEDTTAGFAKIALQRNSAAKFDWAQVQGCLEFTSSTSQASPGACVPGKFLLDTGIDQGYATVTADNGVTGWRYYTASDGTRQAHTQNFTKGWTVTSKFGSDQYEFAFTLGESPLAPPWLATSLNATTPTSLNTGRHFFRINDMMYDATNGVWGARLRYGNQVAASTISTLPASTVSTPSGSLLSQTFPQSAFLNSTQSAGGNINSPTATVDAIGRTTSPGSAGQENANSQTIQTVPNATGSAATGSGDVGAAANQPGGAAVNQPGNGQQSGASGQGESGQSGSGDSQTHQGC